MKKNLIGFIILLVLFFHASITACNITTTPILNGIKINGIEGEDIYAKVFDENWNLLWQCDGWTNMCGSIILARPLSIGQYRVSVMSSECEFYEIVEVVESTENCSSYDVVHSFYTSPIYAFLYETKKKIV